MTAVEGATVSVVASGRATVRVKYLGPTNHRGSRIVVGRFDSADGRDPTRITVGWDYSMGMEGNYLAAVGEYLRRMSWPGKWVVSLTDTGAVAVRVPEQ